MTLIHFFKEGTPILFKWYESFWDEFENPNRFKTMDGVVVDSNERMIFIFNSHENKTYAIERRYIIKVF